jgi:hypothetical protein
MRAGATQGFVVFRTWAEDGSLAETSQAFQTLDDLFILCLNSGEKQPVDRVIVLGNDAAGTARRLVLGFQSLTSGEDQHAK